MLVSILCLVLGFLDEHKQKMNECKCEFVHENFKNINIFDCHILYVVVAVLCNFGNITRYITVVAIAEFND